MIKIHKFLDSRQEKLLEFVISEHGEQKRKYTGEPYWHHVYSVANIVYGFVKECPVVEIALCHDLLEDTKCSGSWLYDNLYKFGYVGSECLEILNRVNDLTDYYTKERFPELNRRQRKEKEAFRLGALPEISQSVKYADLIDNTSSIVEHDPNFAEIYLKEKLEILNRMRGGNINLLIKCCYIWESAQKHLNKKLTLI